jgi:hypothetical protein
MKLVLLISSVCLAFLTPVSEALLAPTLVTARHSNMFRLNNAATLEQPTVEVPESMETTDTIICGAGPAGLLSAIMLAQKFPGVSCNDVKSEPHPEIVLTYYTLP